MSTWAVFKLRLWDVIINRVTREAGGWFQGEGASPGSQGLVAGVGQGVPAVPFSQSPGADAGSGEHPSWPRGTKWHRHNSEGCVLTGSGLQRFHTHYSIRFLGQSVSFPFPSFLSSLISCNFKTTSLYRAQWWTLIIKPITLTCN